MNYWIEIVHEPVRHLAVVRFHSTPEEIAKRVRTAFGQVGAYLVREGVRPIGPPVSRYEMHDGEFEVATGFPVREPVPGDGTVVPLDLPEADNATTVHVGRYEDLGRAYEALRTGAAEAGHPVDEDAAMWEEYLTGPDEPAEKQRTVVHWPVAASA
ncbi:MAG TPA: GyrI-like domain-containing protein [Marmoricola sp.]|nr:GyrI-like domain-containing protein [Marmoricola sp.]